METLLPFILAALFAIFMALQKSKKSSTEQDDDYQQDESPCEQDEPEMSPYNKETYFTFEQEVELKRIEFENRQSLESELGEDMLSRMRDEAVAEQLIRDEQGSAVKISEPIDFDARRAVIYSEILKRKF